jgi:hypothetical protein
VLNALISKTPDLKFSNDFSEIAADSTRGNLNNKMAVFYVDGNSFGKHQRTESAADLIKWDTDIRELRNILLAELLHDILPEAIASAKDNKSIIRLETLLWGGDEIIFVMPAWRGLAFAQRFFALTAKWEFGKTKLTHAVGMVFCHHNAPIHAIKELASSLANDGKKEVGRESNSLNYVVLESFDHTGSCWKTYLNNMYNGKLSVKNRCLLQPQLQEAMDQLTTLKKALPRSRLMPYMEALISTTADLEKAKERFSHDLDKACCTAIQAMNELVTEKQKDGSTTNYCPIAGWSHIADLWDYIQPPDPETETNSTPTEMEGK